MRNYLFILMLCMALASRVDSSWQKICASYSAVEFQPENESIADSLLKISESSIPLLAQWFQIPLKEFRDDPVRIILVDAIDVSNGFALDNTVVIYAQSSAYIPSWTGSQNWYTQVLNHELAHIMTFRKVRRRANYFGTAAYLATPRWFYEGIAQYTAEDWNAFRGDIDLKDALFNGRLTVNALNNIENGRLLYASGNAFVRYLADQYGDSSLVQLMNYDSSSFVYDFSAAFSKTYGSTPEKIFSRFLRHMIIYYGTEYSTYNEEKRFNELPTFGSQMFQLIPFDTADSTYLISSQSGPFNRYLSAYLTRFRNNKMISLQNLFDNFNTSLLVSNDRQKIAYGRFHLSEKEDINGLSFDWFLHLPEQDQRIRLLSDRHVRFGAFFDDSSLVLCEVEKDTSYFLKYSLKTTNHQVIYSTPMPVGRLVRLSDGKLIFEAQRKNGQRDLFLFSSGTISDLTDDPADDRMPVIVHENRFVFTRIEDHKPALCLYEMDRMDHRIILDDLNDYWSHSFLPDGQKLIVTRRETTNRFSFSMIALDSLISAARQQDKSEAPARYQSWTSKRPDPDLLNQQTQPVESRSKAKVILPYFPLEHGLTFAFPVYDNSYGVGLFGITSWFEILQRQALASTFILYPKELERSLLFLTHLIKIKNFQLTSVYYHGPVLFSNDQNNHIDMIRDLAALNISRNLHLRGDQRLLVIPSAALIWNRYRVKDRQVFRTLNDDLFTVRAGGAFLYEHQTGLTPFLPQRQIGFYTFIHQTADAKKHFSIWEAGVFGGTTLLSEWVGLKTHISLLRQNGSKSQAYRIGIDRFFETNLPRDYGFTRPVRGVREDIYGRTLKWATAELKFFITRNPGMKILFIPLLNLSLGGFFDFAEISSANRDMNVSGYGAEITAGDNNIRYGLGYARGRKSDGSTDNQWYWRFSLSFPQPVFSTDRIEPGRHLKKEIPNRYE